MRHLSKLGATAFDDQYTVVDVSAYLLSVRLRTISVDPKKLSEGIGVSLRTAQRYVYNSHKTSVPCLSSIYRCLKFIGVSLGTFFKDVDRFLDNKTHIAFYDLKKNKVIQHTKDEYESIEYDKSLLERSMKVRKNIIEKCGLVFVRTCISEVDNEISQFPSHMIKGK